MTATTHQTLVRDYQGQPDGFVTPADMPFAEIVAEIKAIRAALDAGPGAYGNTRLWWRWNSKDFARHSAAVKRGMGAIKEGRRPGGHWDWNGWPVACPTCGCEFKQGWAGRLRKYCSNACRQRAYRQRATPTDQQPLPTTIQVAPAAAIKE